MVLGGEAENVLIYFQAEKDIYLTGIIT